jgi:hypothetical protein
MHEINLPSIAALLIGSKSYDILVCEFTKDVGFIVQSLRINFVLHLHFESFLDSPWRFRGCTFSVQKINGNPCAIAQSVKSWRCGYLQCLCFELVLFFKQLEWRFLHVLKIFFNYREQQPNLNCNGI